MIGGGVLTECLADPRVEAVTCLVRRPLGREDPKVREVIVPDLFDLASHRDELDPFDACFYCLGVSSAGMSESDYRRITYDLTLAVVEVLAEVNPHMTICFVSGQGTDSSEKGRVMWARVKGAAENALIAREFTTYLFRPGLIQPMKGARSRTRLYNAFYALLTPAWPILRRLFPGSITTTERMGRAMIRAAIDGCEKQVLETRDINQLGS